MTDAKGQGKSVEELFPCPFFTGAETGQCKSNGSLLYSTPSVGRSCKTVKGSDKGSNRKKEVRNLTVSDFSVAAGEGFEPSHTESESAVLPLHNPAIWCRSLCCVVQRTYVIIAGTFDLSTGKFPKNRVLEIFLALRHIQMANRRSTGSSTRRRRLLCCHSSAVTRRL